MQTSKAPRNKMIIELDGQDATLIIQAVQKRLEYVKQKHEEYRAKQLEYILHKLNESKRDFHEEWSEHMITHINSTRHLQHPEEDEEIYPSCE